MTRCCKNLAKDLEAENHSDCFSAKTVAAEEGKVFRIANKSKKAICRVRIDGCLIKSKSTKKCDFLFKVCESERYLLVELKGSNVEDGFAQLISTFRHLKDKLGVEPGHVEGFIVSTRVPRAANLKVRRSKEQTLKKYQLRVQVTSRKHLLSV